MPGCYQPLAPQLLHHDRSLCAGHSRQLLCQPQLAAQTLYKVLRALQAVQLVQALVWVARLSASEMGAKGPSGGLKSGSAKPSRGALAALDCIVSVAFRCRPAKRIGSADFNAVLPSLRLHVAGSTCVTIWLHACSIKLLMGCMGVPVTLNLLPA